MITAKLILTVYFIFFISEFVFENVLTILNLKHINRNSDEVPTVFKGHIDKAHYVRSVEYTKTRQKYGMIQGFFGVLLVAAVILSGFLGVVNQWLLSFGFPEMLHRILYVMVISLMFRIFSIPFSLYSQFVIEQRYGFNTMSAGLFFIDLLKGSILSAVIGAVLLSGIFLFMDIAGPYWWIVAFVFIAVFQLVMSVLYPLVIAPLFNKFRPLEEGELRDRLFSLCKKLDFKVSGLFLMDGSKRSKHSNAYFTGIGKAKRIVLFDTLVDTMSVDEIEAVLAHEIGHEKKKHTLKRLIVSFVLMAVSLFIIQLLMDVKPLYTAFGFNQQSNYAILVILAFFSGPFSFFFTPLFSMWSRKHEYEADRYAVEAVGSEKPLSEALIRLVKDNLSNLAPHPLYSFYHYSHPAVSERIKAMKKYAQTIKS